MKHLPLISCEVIDHKFQDYDTAGNFSQEGKEWFFEISRMSSPDYEFLVLMHELTEWYLTQKRGISEPSITKFDTIDVFKKDINNADDPGRSKFAPYHAEHMFATRIEKMIAKELQVNWQEYDRQFEDLVYKKEAK